MKKVLIKNKKVTIGDLAVMIADGREETSELARMVAKGFESVDTKFAEVKKEFAEVKRDIAEVKENLGRVEDNLNTTRMDVLGIGDKFVSRHDFNQHLIRFDLLEQRVKTKK